MKFMTTWSVRPDDRGEAIQQFLAGKGAAPEGMTLLGRWHKADGSGGFTLMETNDPKVIYADSAFWSQYLDLQSVVVIEDPDAGATLTKLFSK